MIRIFRIVLFVVCVFGVTPAMYAEKTVEKSTVSTAKFDWEPVMKAIIQVESEGNTKAVRGKSCGAMQITPILVAECNNILKGRNSKTRYTLRDRFNLEKSKEMFLLMQVITWRKPFVLGTVATITTRSALKDILRR